MAKDPAFLFYSNDFLEGTMTMTDEQVGRYIRLLCLQHQRGGLKKRDIEFVCKGDDEAVMEKFSQEEDGLYRNNRLKTESEKRNAYTESRRKNRMSNICETHDSHMENENVNENINVNKVNKGVASNAKGLMKQFDVLWMQYPRKLGRKLAVKHFKASVKNENDLGDIKKAMDNFKKSKVVRGDPQYIPYGSTWFNNWTDWINDPEPKTQKDVDDEIKQRIFRDS